MYLGELCNENFVFMDSNLNISMARDFIEHLNPSHVILRRFGPSTRFYLFGRYDFIGLLSCRRDEHTISDALDWRKDQPTPTRDSYSDPAEAPNRAIVIQDGYVIGFCDKTVPPEFIALSASDDFTGNENKPRPRREPDSDGPSGPQAAPARSASPDEKGGGERVKPPRRDLTRPVSRSLVVDFPEKVPLGQTHSLLVSLSVEAGSSANLPIVLPSRETIDVIVQPKHGFVVEGLSEGALVVDDPARSSFQFKLRTTEVGVGRITLFVFHQQRPQGSLTLTPTVVEHAEPVGKRQKRKKQLETPVSVVQPDLSLFIFAEDKTTLNFRLSALDARLEYHMKPFGPIKLQLDPLGYVQNRFRELEKLPLETLEQRKFAQTRIEAIGSMLFENAIPADLKIALWSLRDRIKAVRIDSQEPWIPWEICKLFGIENGDVTEGPFFCEAFEITRWQMGIGLKPTLNLKNMALVLPRNSGLKSADDEGAYVQSLGNKERRVTRVSAKYLDVISQMKKGEFDGWHFTGHGDFTAPDPNRSVVVLEDRHLTPEDICGVVKNVGKPKPLVFLNACRTGQNALSLTKIGGWASQFLEAGAGAFVGAYWSVYDHTAQQFAKHFYDGLLRENITIGQAVLKARLAIKEPGDPTWLAYTVFADPMATIERP